LPDRTAGPSSGGMGRRTLVTFVGGRRRVVGGAAAGHNENVARAPSGGSRGARAAAAAELVCGLGHIIPLSAITSLSCAIFMLTSGGCGDPIACHARCGSRACCGSGAGPPAREACLAARRRLPGSVCPVEGRRGRVVAWCFGTVAWFKSLCVWAALVAPISGPAPLPGGGAAMSMLCRRPRRLSGRRVRRRRLSPVASLWGWVRVCCNPIVPWLVREPRGWGFRGCVVAAGGQAGVGRVTTAQARGQLATESVARSG